VRAGTFEDGTATGGDWMMGPTPGVNTMQATVDGTSLPPLVITATGMLYGFVIAGSPSAQAVNRADAFTLSLPLMGRVPAARALRLGNDAYRGPRSRIDRHGRVMPI
jgi:hypothetical protein